MNQIKVNDAMPSSLKRAREEEEEETVNPDDNGVDQIKRRRRNYKLQDPLQELSHGEKEENRRLSVLEEAENMQNQMKALEKLNASIIMYEYFDLMNQHCNRQGINARNKDKKEDLNLANLKAIIRYHGETSDTGIKIMNSIKDGRNSLLHNSPELNELMSIERLRGMTELYAIALEAVGEFDDANHIRQKCASLLG